MTSQRVGEQLLLPTIPPEHPCLPYADWVWLNPGDKVVVQRTGQVPVSGTIDLVSDDASIIWVWLDAGGGRIAIWEGDSSKLWLPNKGLPLPQQATCRTCGSASEIQRSMMKS